MSIFAKCPFYNQSYHTEIICSENEIDGVIKTVIKFETYNQKRNHEENFCDCDCYKGCPLYQGVMKKYEKI